MNPSAPLVVLAQLPEKALLDEGTRAQALQVTKRRIRRMVARYELPPPVSFGGRSTWLAGAVLRWFENRAEKAARTACRGAEACERLETGAS